MSELTGQPAPDAKNTDSASVNGAVSVSQRAESIDRTMHPLFHADQGGSIPTSALTLRIERIEFDRAIYFNRAWHSILPRFGTGFIKRQPFPCFAIVHANRVYGVAIWSNPVARKLPQDIWLELRRMAISADAPRNTASRMLAIMRRILSVERPELSRVVSYQSKSVHTGAIYRADGWRAVAECKGDTWNTRKRPRPEAQQIDARIRWERPIVGPPERVVNHNINGS